MEKPKFTGPEGRQVWITLFAAAITGVKVAQPSWTPTTVVREAAEIADEAIEELKTRNQEGAPGFVVLGKKPQG